MTTTPPPPAHPEPIGDDGPPLRMNAYYYGFNETKVRVVDEVLSAVATAGKMYHHTESWSDEDGEPSYAEKIQRAAEHAAKEIERLRSAVSTAREDLARAEACRRAHILPRQFEGRTVLWCLLCKSGEWHLGEPESHAADCLARPFKGET